MLGKQELETQAEWMNQKISRMTALDHKYTD